MQDKRLFHFRQQETDRPVTPAPWATFTLIVVFPRLSVFKLDACTPDRQDVYCSSGPKILFSNTKCAVGNGDCAVAIYLMCSSIFSNELVRHDQF